MSMTPKIGAFVLETLTTGMYRNSMDTVREFVQNATDSIFEAEKNKLIQVNTGRIDIKIDPDSYKLIIKDNGGGVPKEKIYSRLINIGMSEKDFTTNAGFRGIGRLAGIAYCQTLSFRTLAPGEKIVSTVKIDCEKLCKIIHPDGIRHVEELTDVIAKNTEIQEDKATSDDHFFEVIMEGVNQAGKDLLSWELLENYLSQVAPVGFDAQRFYLAPKIIKWVEDQGIIIPTVTLIVKTPKIEREIFKSYKNRYETQNSRDGNHEFEIEDIEFYPKSITSNMPFWIWYGKIPFFGTVEDDKSAGLRLRAKNIAIGGPEAVAELFEKNAKTDGRFNAWYIGEIYILSPGAFPNARRDRFEDIGEWPKIKESLMNFFREQVKETRKISEERNIIKKTQKVLDDFKERQDIGFVTPEHREELAQRVDEAQRLIEKLEKKTSRQSKQTEDIPKQKEQHKEIEEVIKPIKASQILQNTKRALQETKQVLQEEKSFKPKLKADLDHKQLKLITEILKILYQILDEQSYKKAESAILTHFKDKV